MGSLDEHHKITERGWSTAPYPLKWGRHPVTLNVAVCACLQAWIWLIICSFKIIHLFGLLKYVTNLKNFRNKWGYRQGMIDSLPNYSWLFINIIEWETHLFYLFYSFKTKTQITWLSIDVNKRQWTDKYSRWRTISTSKWFMLCQEQLRGKIQKKVEIIAWIDFISWKYSTYISKCKP